MKATVAALVLLFLASCSQPRAHAHVRVTPDGPRVAPSVSTSILGIGLTVTR
ncbi:hypothetical protein LV82_01883 [Albidovulum inexpectatum]|uniref:Uncharacterized protein n=1 Tax=Albidovulum inexpectatum TaxID=196587 RepID=A0A2S5JGB6_9RHOB|nr:hypothetical protein [Albidovulum inexpectatum]PPB80534.1 hypothetical protein LV82_01883 [Albidovulum inexpectatum]